MVEIDRPSRKTRRAAGKSDPIDAEAAARAALGKVRTGTPKNRDGQVEALRNLRIARNSAVSQRADCMRRIKALIVTAPHDLRQQLRGLTSPRLIHTCHNLCPDPTQIATPQQAIKTALRSLARRHLTAQQEIAELDQLITELIDTINPELLTLNGVGPDVAGQLLVTIDPHLPGPPTNLPGPPTKLGVPHPGCGCGTPDLVGGPGKCGSGGATGGAGLGWWWGGLGG